MVRILAPKMSASCFLLTSIVHSTDKNRERKRQRPKSPFSAPVASFLFRGYFK
nr:MAG TPA: hypothetical protein [Caudoviricetes sp.]